MIRSLLLTAVLFAASAIQAQDRWFTREGHIRFHSHTPMEDIEADNHQVNAIIDFASGEMAFSLLMKSFEFEKALMEEHFNEKYVESAKFPKAIFEGRIGGNVPDPTKAGEVEVPVTGKLTIHGVTREVSTNGTLTSDGNGLVTARAVFSVKPADHDISIPGVVRDNIAESIEVTVDATLAPLGK